MTADRIEKEQQEKSARESIEKNWKLNQRTSIRGTAKRANYTEKA